MKKLALLALLIPFMVSSHTYVATTTPEPILSQIDIDTTAYSEIDSCHYEGCPMASGKRAYVGAIACPRDWELGTQVIINGRKYTCEDRYNADLSDRLDIFQGYGKEAHEKAINYGIKKLRVWKYENS